MQAKQFEYKGRQIEIQRERRGLYKAFDMTVKGWKTCIAAEQGIQATTQAAKARLDASFEV
jgi:hypothetical protein